MLSIKVLVRRTKKEKEKEQKKKEEKEKVNFSRTGHCCVERNAKRGKNFTRFLLIASTAEGSMSFTRIELIPLRNE